VRKLSLMSLLGLLTVGCMPGCWLIPVDRPPKYDAIYRYINVGHGQRINLGEQFQFPDLGTRVDDSTIVLHRDAVADPDSIRLLLTPGGKIYAMDFLYRSDESFSGLIATYTKSLGAPTKPSNRDAEWDDGLTNFRIRWTGGDTVGSLGSRLTDLTTGR
jgi:hypothetical protein